MLHAFLMYKAPFDLMYFLIVPLSLNTSNHDVNFYYQETLLQRLPASGFLRPRVS